MYTAKNIFNKTFISFFILSLFAGTIFSQQKQENNFGISFSGYVKTDIMYDSRQTVSLREGHFLLFPTGQSLDKNGADINSKSNFNILSLQTRLTGKIKGPDAFGAATSGVLEGEFFGTSDADANGFRLRHAYVSLKWESTILLIGQTWHPMFVLDVFPQTVSFNTGAPFQPFSRNPQIRLTQSFGKINLIAAVISQRDFTSSGPAGLNSAYLRNSVIPNIHLQVQFKSENIIVGAGADVKSLTPRIETTKKIVTDSRINSLAWLGYTKINIAPFTLLVEGVYGKNLSDLLMLGGYAIKSIDTVSGYEEYTGLKTLSLWSDLTYGKDFQIGLFVGYSKNLGADDPIVGSYYSRINNIDYIYRISPRVQVTSGQTRFAFEAEHTSAAYGTLDNKGVVCNTEIITNLRLLLAVYYFF